MQMLLNDKQTYWLMNMKMYPILFCDIEGIENVLNLENIAMLELPFLPFENKIYDEYIRAVEK